MTIDRLNNTTPENFPKLLEEELSITATWYRGRRFAIKSCSDTISFDQLMAITKEKFPQQENNIKRFNIMKCLLKKHRQQPRSSDWRIIRLVQWILSHTFIPIYRWIKKSPDHLTDIAQLMQEEMQKAKNQEISLPMGDLEQPLKKILTDSGIRDSDEKTRVEQKEQHAKGNSVKAEELFKKADEEINKSWYFVDPVFWKERLTWVPPGKFREDGQFIVQQPSRKFRIEETPLYKEAKNWIKLLNASSGETSNYHVNGIIFQLKEAAKLGSAQAHVYLGNWFENQVKAISSGIFEVHLTQSAVDAIKSDYPVKAFEHMKAAAEQDNPEAMKRLAEYYKQGFGCKPSPSDEIYWQKRFEKLAGKQ